MKELSIEEEHKIKMHHSFYLLTFSLFFQMKREGNKKKQSSWADKNPFF